MQLPWNFEHYNMCEVPFLLRFLTQNASTCQIENLPPLLLLLLDLHKQRSMRRCYFCYFKNTFCSEDQARYVHDIVQPHTLNLPLLDPYCLYTL